VTGATPGTGFEVQVYDSPAQWEALLPAWNALRLVQKRRDIQHRPEWLRLETDPSWTNGRSGRVVAVFRAKDLVGLAPLVFRRWSWKCRLGYLSLVSFPVRLADVCGDDILSIDEPAAQEALVAAVAAATSGCDVVVLESLAVDSPLWHLVHRPGSPLQSHFHAHVPQGIGPRRVMEIASGRDGPLTHLSGRSRSTLRRKIKKLEEAESGQLRVECFREAERVGDFLREVEGISRSSWQGMRLGRVTTSDSTGERRFQYIASLGWLRSYLLTKEKQAIAYLIGYQADGIFYYDDAAYDTAWSSFSPGMVLMCRVLEDLAGIDPPREVDFGYGESPLKSLLGTRAWPEANVYLLRRSSYGAVIRATDAVTRSLSSGAKRVLGQLGIRERIRQILRRAGRVPPGGRPSPGGDEE
jgi:Acetyltransferase (GNAT) domain